MQLRLQADKVQRYELHSHLCVTAHTTTTNLKEFFNFLLLFTIEKNLVINLIRQMIIASVKIIELIIKMIIPSTSSEQCTSYYRSDDTDVEAEEIEELVYKKTRGVGKLYSDYPVILVLFLNNELSVIIVHIIYFALFTLGPLAILLSLLFGRLQVLAGLIPSFGAGLFLFPSLKLLIALFALLPLAKQSLHTLVYIHTIIVGQRAVIIDNLVQETAQRHPGIVIIQLIHVRLQHAPQHFFHRLHTLRLALTLILLSLVFFGRLFGPVPSGLFVFALGPRLVHNGVKVFIQIVVVRIVVQVIGSIVCQLFLLIQIARVVVLVPLVELVLWRQMSGHWAEQRLSLAVKWLRNSLRHNAVCDVAGRHDRRGVDPGRPSDHATGRHGRDTRAVRERILHEGRSGTGLLVWRGQKTGLLGRGHLGPDLGQTGQVRGSFGHGWKCFLLSLDRIGEWCRRSVGLDLSGQFVADCHLLLLQVGQLGGRALKGGDLGRAGAAELIFLKPAAAIALFDLATWGAFSSLPGWLAWLSSLDS
ncbi:hypothetical protein BpHYR1_032663 [Brachionus plicatilis]|uniref:Uncharacterized protein n=1 Tax=Brachionus plicatilis TaxID=10195 RepID=A0A3M7RAG4_BRAPC|nr:hypothetical protein BpHYR1_032663 [Brachionus plicatilis]